MPPIDYTTLPACTQEDGSDVGQVLPCRWDATVQGNGIGKSFILTEAGGEPIYDATPVVQPEPSPEAVLICPEGTWANDALTGCEPLPEQVQAQVQVLSSPPVELAHTGAADTVMGMGVAALMVVVGIMLVRADRRSQA